MRIPGPEELEDSAVWDPEGPTTVSRVTGCRVCPTAIQAGPGTDGHSPGNPREDTPKVTFILYFPQREGQQTEPSGSEGITCLDFPDSRRVEGRKPRFLLRGRGALLVAAPRARGHSSVPGLSVAGGRVPEATGRAPWGAGLGRDLFPGPSRCCQRSVLCRHRAGSSFLTGRHHHSQTPPHCLAPSPCCCPRAPLV